MKKLFGKNKESQQDWEPYDDNSYDWDAEEQDELGEEEYPEDSEGEFEGEETYEEASEAEYEDENFEGDSEAEYEEESYEEDLEAEYEEESYEEDSEAQYEEENYEEDSEVEYEEESGVEVSEEEYEGEDYEEASEEEYAEEVEYAETGSEEYEGSVEEYETVVAQPEYFETEEEAQELSENLQEDGEFEDGEFEDGEYDDAPEGPYEETEIEFIDAFIEDEQASGRKKKRKKRVSGMDVMISVAAIVVLVLAGVTGMIFLNNRNVTDQLASFTGVGKELDGIDMIGEKGLLAVADEELAKMAAANAVLEEQQEEEESEVEYQENDYEKNVIVSMTMTSVQKDLKIKFSNRETGKLISNVPFAVEIIDPDQKKDVWTDDDMDGIIYKKNITPGTYSVTLKELDEEKYKNYTVSTTAQTVEVQKDIAYKKVDVSNEIKKESEVNVSAEDTKKNETVVESSLADTVEWVASSSSAGSAYTEVLRSEVPDPKTVVEAGVFDRTAASISATSHTMAAGSSFKLTAKYVDDTTKKEVPFSSVVWSTSDADVATVDDKGNVTAKSAGTAVISYTGFVKTVSDSDKEETFTGSCMVTVKAAGGNIVVDSPAVELPIDATAVIKATANGYEAGRTLTYSVSSDKEAVAKATVDASGNVSIKGISAGTAKITVSVNYNDGDAKSLSKTTITATVVGEGAITLEKQNVVVFLTEPVTIKATVRGNAAANVALQAESSDANVVTASVSGQNITLTGVNGGSAVLTVKFTENGVETKTTCAVTVRVHPKDDKFTKLLDSNKEQLYVLENDVYREAVYADYYVVDKFYVMNGVKYTGWQTIDGKVYYYNAKGVAVTGEQVIQGAKYNFASDGTLVTGSGTMGIDVSKWNGSIDWKAVKNSGISYVIIRCGYRGSSQGALIEDPKFSSNIKGASEAGLKVGVYFFTQAIDEVEAVYEASFVLEKVKNYKISYPIFLDVEPSGGRGDKIDKATRTKVCKAFCATIQSAGYTAGVYANKTWLNEKIDAGALGGYKIWLAQYAATPTYTGRYDMWQYKSTGKVSGISGNVDLNTSYLGY